MNSLKRTIVRILLLVIVAASGTSCGLFDSGTSWESDQFRIGWIDTHSTSDLSYRLDDYSSIGIVDACVFAAGANDQYVVVKQRPVSAPGIINYYVLSRVEYDPLGDLRRALTGPISEAAYRELSLRFSLPTVAPVVPEVVCGGETA
ncbi:hypothetical protein QFW77_02630 [Luteimonas sp. RD2P54]|uniref:DUF3997 domain-containing protein n=1 Tax=Luteimonas endophytica TaxID=3042023 RepID=A0ABT6J4Z7_9GAMM|nr:hypothetical protein [Luteimonas endophytica]MDH5821891.1 hypothetical protein [Luteimonas endophytica]